MLKAVGAPDWQSVGAHDEQGGEVLVEVAGRLCYRSFEAGLNKNVTKVREGNKEYIGNILKQGHGSVLEHASVTFALVDVSRVLTHEVVRHRAGTAFSQESGRYIRIDDVGQFFPSALAGNALRDLAMSRGMSAGEASIWGATQQKLIGDAFRIVSEDCEHAIKTIIDALRLDEPGTPFHTKKAVTSALRRIAPGGQLTNIIVTANHRAWRHMIAMRTAYGAEEEIRLVFHLIGHELKEHFPAIYQDMSLQLEADGTHSYVFNNGKV